MKHILPTEIINKILGYLASKPFVEVNQLISEIQTQAIAVNEKSLDENKNDLKEEVHVELQQ